MTGEDRAGKLRVARHIIQEVVGDLDVIKEDCGKCHHTVYKNWDDAQAWDQLNGVVNKLQKWALIFEMGPKS